MLFWFMDAACLKLMEMYADEQGKGHRELWGTFECRFELMQHRQPLDR